MSRLALASLLTLGIALMPRMVNAALNNCTVGATGLTFGGYDAGSSLTTTGTIQISGCNGSGSGTVSLDKGQNSTTFNPRNLKDTAGDLLNYIIYTTISCSGTIWGDGTGSTGTVNFNGNGTISFCASIPSGQTNAGVSTTYGDSVKITVNF